MSRRLTLHNRAREQPIDMALLRRIVRRLLRDSLQANVAQLGIYILAEEEMIRLNETYLRHGGVTDVITFNYADHREGTPLLGEIFVCVDEARIQAKRFRTSWQEELIRYIVHGILHLQGYNDGRKAERLRMKRRENQLLKQLTAAFPLQALGSLGYRNKS